MNYWLPPYTDPKSPPYSGYVLSCDPKCAISLSPIRRPKPQRQDGLTGGKGLNMNYSIIFTEISFYSGTSETKFCYK